MTRLSRLGLLILCAIFISAILIGLSHQAAAQQRSLPRQTYYQSFFQYYQADYKDAGNDFQRGGNTAFRTGLRRYLDSICYWTYVGECYYHLGEYGKAIEMYEQSLKLYISYQRENWQARIQLPPSIQSNNNAFQQARITWGTPKRVTTIARMPNTISVLFGRMDAERVLETGGMVENAKLTSVDVIEIMRCTALCLHRRRVIKGPTSKHDPFTQQVISGLRTSNAGNKSLLGSLNGTLLGIALASNGEWKKASKMLNNSTSFRGKMDHPLTPVALLELANIGYETQNYSVAGDLALEASYSAAVFNQFDLVEESLSLGTTLHLMKSKTPYPPLENAIKWAGTNRAKLMQASLIVRLAECLAEGGQADLAANVLRQTKTPINSRNSLGNCVVSARLKYVKALIRFLNSDFRGGLSDLNAAIKHFQKGSFWLYRLQLANQLASTNAINQRQADSLYGVLLRDPTELDWKTDPFEALAYLASPHVRSIEFWFDIVVDRKDFNRAFDIADLVRRHRFFASLPLGGRLMSFRWVMHAPDSALTTDAIGQRQKFIAANRNYAGLKARAGQIRDSLIALPLKPAGKEENEQKKLFKELDEISTKQEAILASYALRRQPSEMVFPPNVSLRELQKSISPDQLAMATLRTSQGYSVFLVSAKTTSFVGLFSEKDIMRQVAKLLKGLKVSEIGMDVNDLKDSDWKDDAEELKDLLFGGIEDYNWSRYKELVVIPDGVLWYVPFEALAISLAKDEDAADAKADVAPADEADVPDEKEFLSDLVNIRYAPTASLAFGAQRPWKEIKKTVAITGRMFARSDDENSKAAFEDLKKALPDAVGYEKAIRTPTNYLASLFDQLIVWNEMKPTKGKHYQLVPTQIDQSKTGATIGAWMSLPWWGPEHVVMPGYHSDGGQGLRTKQYGNDLFLTSIGLMASGSRTALISRWATGGKSALDLSRKYSENLDRLGPLDSIRISRESVREMDLVYDQEPRLRGKKSDPVLKAEHPYFWAGPMLLVIPSKEMPAERKAEFEEALKAEQAKLDDAVEADMGEDKAKGAEEPDKEFENDKAEGAKGAEEAKKEAMEPEKDAKPKTKGLFAKPRDKKDKDKS